MGESSKTMASCPEMLAIKHWEGGISSTTSPTPSCKEQIHRWANQRQDSDDGTTVIAMEHASPTETTTTKCRLHKFCAFMKKHCCRLDVIMCQLAFALLACVLILSCLIGMLIRLALALILNKK